MAMDVCVDVCTLSVSLFVFVFYVCESLFIPIYRVYLTDDVEQ